MICFSLSLSLSLLTIYFQFFCLQYFLLQKYFQLADRSMEPDAVWAPCEFQPAHWSMEVGDFELDNWYTEPAYNMFGSCLQTSAPSSSGVQMTEHQAGTQNHPIEEAGQDFEADFHIKEMKAYILGHAFPTPVHLFEKEAQEFTDDMNTRKTKVSRYPESIRALGESYTVPTLVAIGPYHHHRDKLKRAEKVKHVAACHCIRESGHSVQEMYKAVVSVGSYARSVYNSADVEGISDDDFLPMMFYDACFLVQFMRIYMHSQWPCRDG